MVRALNLLIVTLFAACVYGIAFCPAGDIPNTSARICPQHCFGHACGCSFSASYCRSCDYGREPESYVNVTSEVLVDTKWAELPMETEKPEISLRQYAAIENGPYSMYTSGTPPANAWINSLTGSIMVPTILPPMYGQVIIHQVYIVNPAGYQDFSGVSIVFGEICTGSVPIGNWNSWTVYPMSGNNQIGLVLSSQTSVPLGTNITFYAGYVAGGYYESSVTVGSTTATSKTTSTSPPTRAKFQQNAYGLISTQYCDTHYSPANTFNPLQLSNYAATWNIGGSVGAMDFNTQCANCSPANCGISRSRNIAGTTYQLGK
jgi:hypothetical protein